MERIFVRKPLPYRQIEGYSIAHLGEKKVYLNKSGTKIWNLIDGKRSEKEIALSLARELNAPDGSRDEIRAKVSSFLDNLYGKGLLGLNENGSPEYSKGAAEPAADKSASINNANESIKAVQEICMTPKLVAKEPASIEQRIEKLYWEKNYIQKMHVELTYRCNFRCVHCYNTTHGGGSTELTADEWRSALDQLADMGCWLLTFTGGEVFVRKDIIPILQHACERGFSFRLNTNGSLISEKTLEAMEPMRPFLQSFDISIYGADAVVHDALAKRPGSYFQTKRALHLLREANFPVVSKFVTMRDNFDGIDKFESDMQRLGIRYVVHTGALIPQTNRDTKPLVQLLTDDQYKRLMLTRSTKGFSEAGNCKPGHVRGAITPDGYVSPCEWLTDFKYGNLRESSLREIWYSPGFLRWRRRFDQEHSECPTCSLRPGCSRCPAHSYLETGDIFTCAPIQRHNAELCREIGVFDV